MLEETRHSRKAGGISVKVMCPVCGLEFEVPEGKGPGDKVVCPWCEAELVLAEEEGKLVAREV